MARSIALALELLQIGPEDQVYVMGDLNMDFNQPRDRVEEQVKSLLEPVFERLRIGNSAASADVLALAWLVVILQHHYKESQSSLPQLAPVALPP